MEKRISEGMTLGDAVYKVSEGNPGAVVAIGQMMKAAELVVPDNPPGYVAFALDELGAYGSSVWIYYKDWCGGDPNKALSLLVARSLNLVEFTASDLAESKRGEPCPFNVDEVVQQVHEYAIKNY